MDLVRGDPQNPHPQIVELVLGHAQASSREGPPEVDAQDAAIQSGQRLKTLLGDGITVVRGSQMPRRKVGTFDP